jgi:hypothetical protein
MALLIGDEDQVSKGVLYNGENIKDQQDRPNSCTLVFRLQPHLSFSTLDFHLQEG